MSSSRHSSTRRIHTSLIAPGPYSSIEDDEGRVLAASSSDSDDDRSLSAEVGPLDLEEPVELPPARIPVLAPAAPVKRNPLKKKNSRVSFREESVDPDDLDLAALINREAQIMAGTLHDEPVDHRAEHIDEPEEEREPEDDDEMDANEETRFINLANPDKQTVSLRDRAKKMGQAAAATFMSLVPATQSASLAFSGIPIAELIPTLIQALFITVTFTSFMLASGGIGLAIASMTANIGMNMFFLDGAVAKLIQAKDDMSKGRFYFLLGLFLFVPALGSALSALALGYAPFTKILGPVPALLIGLISNALPTFFSRYFAVSTVAKKITNLIVDKEGNRRARLQERFVDLTKQLQFKFQTPFASKFDKEVKGELIARRLDTLFNPPRPLTPEEITMLQPDKPMLREELEFAIQWMGDRLVTLQQFYSSEAIISSRTLMSYVVNGLLAVINIALAISVATASYVPFALNGSAGTQIALGTFRNTSNFNYFTVPLRLLIGSPSGLATLTLYALVTHSFLPFLGRYVRFLRRNPQEVPSAMRRSVLLILSGGSPLGIAIRSNNILQITNRALLIPYIILATLGGLFTNFKSATLQKYPGIDPQLPSPANVTIENLLDYMTVMTPLEDPDLYASLQEIIEQLERPVIKGASDELERMERGASSSSIEEIVDSEDDVTQPLTGELIVARREERDIATRPANPTGDRFRLLPKRERPIDTLRMPPRSQSVVGLKLAGTG